MSAETQVNVKEIRDKQIDDKKISEKRRESRRAADGVAHVEFSNPRTVKIQGRLMDVSPSGFRMAHGYTSSPRARWSTSRTRKPRDRRA